MKSFLASIIAVIVLFSLALPFSAATAAPANVILPAPQSITLPGGYFIPIEIDSVSNSTWIVYQVSSNVSISTALMNSDQFNTYNNSQTADISSSLVHQNGTTAQADLQVSLGPYYLVFYNGPNSQTANITFTFITYPYTPFVAGPLTPPEPMGIASFGLYNVSGNSIPYSVETPMVVGSANISSIQAYNSSASTLNDTLSGATLQLNAVLVAQGNNSQKVYWAQDTPDFVTNASQVSYNDNLWNNTDLAGFLSNQTVTSPNGPSVYPTGSNQTQSQYFYAFGTNNYTYALPFDFKLLLNETVQSGQSVTVQVGMQILGNGTIVSPSSIFWFDNITISTPGVQRAFFYVSGNDSTPVGSYYDAELVYGGEGNLEATNFTQMNSTLGLYYLNSSSSALSPFPSYFSFGGDTGESADNLQVSYIGGGVVHVTPGTENLAYLGTVSNITTSTSSSSSATTSSSGSTASSSTPSQATSSSSSSSSSSGASALSGNYFLVVVPAALVIIFAGTLALRREKSRV